MEPYRQHSQFAPGPTPQRPQIAPGSAPHHSQHIVEQHSQLTNSSGPGQPQLSIPLNPQHPQATELPNRQPDQRAPKPRNAGRKKIKIAHIEDDRSRQVTFLKRKNGILKKAHELSVLCGCDVHAIVFNNDNGKLYEYFNPSATDTLLRYANYVGPSERRCSDVTDLEESKEDADIPNEEPALASAATSAAEMAALRHAHPENYEHPPPGLKRIHPNVGVPRVQIPPSTTPVHASLAENCSHVTLAWRNSRTAAASPSTPSSSQRTFPGSSTPVRPMTLSPTVRISHSQVPTMPQNIGKSGSGYYGSTPSRTLHSAGSLPFHIEHHPVAPHTQRNQISDCLRLPSIAHNAPLNKIDNHKLANVFSPSGGVGHRLEAAVQRQSLGSTCTAPSPDRGDLVLSSLENDVKMSGGDSDTDIPSFNNPQDIASVLSRSAGPEFSTAHPAIYSAEAGTGTPVQAPCSSLVGPWNVSNTTPRRSVPGTPADEPWNSPFFRQHMQHFETAQQELPPLTPFLVELHHHAQENATGSNSLLREAGLDAFSSPPNAGLIPFNTPGPISLNSLTSADTIQTRDAGDSSDDGGDSKRSRLD